MTIESQLNEETQNQEDISSTEDTLKVDVSADVAALTEGEELSDEFKTKAATIFETAVVTRVKAEVAKLEEGFEQRVEKDVEEKVKGIYEKVDGYLDYCVEQWMEENKIAVEHNMRTEITEGFIKGLKTLFKESYIEIPEEKVDVVSELSTEVETLKTKLEEAVNKSIAATKQLEEMTKNELVSEAANGLTDVDVEKFKDLSKELVYEDKESFKEKLKVIRESYFKVTKSDVQSVVSGETTDVLEESATTKKSTSPTVAKYASVMDKLF